MAVGLQTSATEINNTLGNLARDLFSVYQRGRAIGQRLTLFADADLEAAPISMSAADVAALRATLGVFAQLAGVLDGSGPLPAQPTNYLQELSPILGIGL